MAAVAYGLQRAVLSQLKPQSRLFLSILALDSEEPGRLAVLISVNYSRLWLLKL